MKLIDDEGNLFGVVNVVDALVVLLVLAVVAAGAVLVLQLGAEDPDSATTNVTLDLGAQPTYIVTVINEGDTYNAGDNSQLTITDVHLTPQGDRTRVIVRARLEAPSAGDGISYANAPPRLGRSLSIATNRYEVSGQVRAVGRDTSLATGTTRVVLHDRMAAADARDIAPGDEIRLAGRTVATIQNVTAYATNNPRQRDVYVTATLQAYRGQDGPRFGGSQVRRGQTVRLATDAYTFAGQIERVGTGLARAQADIVLEDTVDIETAARLNEGDVATVAGQQVAEIASVTTYATGNPDRRRVVVGATVETLAYGERERFGRAPIQRGSGVTIATDAYTLSGAIERVGTLEPRGAVATRTVTLRMTDARQDMADAIQPGMTEQSSGETIARITGVSVEPSLIITTGENGSVNVVDHPFLREVTLTTELQVRQTTGGVQFKGRSLRQGSQVVIDTGEIIIRAEVVSVGR
jgi:hypothetical protein